jgi:hypothetical protein
VQLGGVWSWTLFDIVWRFGPIGWQMHYLESHAYFDITNEVWIQAVLNMLLTSIICLLMGMGALLLTRDVNNMVSANTTHTLSCDIAETYIAEKETIKL